MPATPFLTVCFPNMKHSYAGGYSYGYHKNYSNNWLLGYIEGYLASHDEIDVNDIIDYLEIHYES